MTDASPKAAGLVRAALEWVAAGEPDLPSDLAAMNEQDREVLLRSARLCDPELRDRLLGQPGR